MTRVDAMWPERRSQRLHIRVEPHTKQEIEQAAREADMSLSEFVISAVRERARVVLAEDAASATVRFDELVAGLEADLAAIDASFGAYQDIDVVGHEPGEREEHLARMWRAAP